MTKAITSSKSTASKSTALSLITKNMHSKRQLHKPGPFFEKSPEHDLGPSSSSEEEHDEAERFEEKRPYDHEVSWELSMDGKEDEKDKDIGETEWTHEDKAAKLDNTEGASKMADPITLDELLK